MHTACQAKRAIEMEKIGRFISIFFKFESDKDRIAYLNDLAVQIAGSCANMP